MKREIVQPLGKALMNLKKVLTSMSLVNSTNMISGFFALPKSLEYFILSIICQGIQSLSLRYILRDSLRDSGEGGQKGELEDPLLSEE